jgi:DNA-binding MarR family transcriptional regulator
MPRIPILGSSLDGDDELDALRNYYSQWRQNNTAMKSPFFALFRSFKEKDLLKDLDEGALRLYLYFGFVAGNENGASWHSIQTIAKYFGNQTRTIDIWIKKLVDAGLIYRTRDDKKSNTTFLIPYTDAIVNVQPTKKHESDDQDLLDDLLISIRRLSAVYGPIIKVFHIFHWGRDSRSKKVTEDAVTTNFLFIITKRQDGILVGHRHHLRKSADYGISLLNIEEVVIFESPFVYKDSQVAGVAVKHTYRLRQKENIETLIGLMRDLSAISEDTLLQHPSVAYGRIEDVFITNDEEPEELETEQEGED